MAYILILFFLFTSLISLFPLPRKTTRNFAIFSCFAFILIAGLQPEGTTNDYMNYINSYYSVEWFNEAKFEPTFVIIVNLIKATFNDPIFLFVIYAIIGVSIKFLAIKQLTELYIFSILIYLGNFFILHEMTQIRAGVASGFLLLSIRPLYYRDLKSFLLFGLCAISFHFSAVVILPLWFLRAHRINRLFYLLSIPVAYVLVTRNLSVSHLIEFIPIEQIQKLYYTYRIQMDNGIGTEIDIFNMLQLLRCSIWLFLMLNINLLIQKNQFSILLMKIYSLSLLAFILFSDFPVVSFRISELLGVVEIIVFPFVFYVLKPKKVAVFYPILLGSILLAMNLFYTGLVS